MFAGSALALDCNIQLRADIENEVEITAIWKRNGMMLIDTASRMVSDVVENSTSYLSQLMFNPLQLGLDDGVYNCGARVDSQVGFVLGSISQSNSISLRVTGTDIALLLILMRQLPNGVDSYSYPSAGAIHSILIDA